MTQIDLEFLKNIFLHKDDLAKKFTIFYMLIGIFIAIIFNGYIIENTTFFVIIFVLISASVFYILINSIQKLLKNMNEKYNEIEHKNQEYKKLELKSQDRLAPYEFALDNSVDAIYWFTLNGRIVYVNNAACNMLGYTKEEMLDMYLEEMDPNFDRNSAPACMLEIKNTKNWTLDTTQRKKDGTIIHIEVSGHGFIYGGKDYICAFGRDITSKLENRNKMAMMNKELQNSLAEKEILLKEIHHRVKNNMEIISSLLSMQYRRVQDDEVKYILKQSRSRINTMALVHEFLYLGENLAYINLEDYIKKLVDDIKELYLSNNTYLTADLNIDQMEFSTNRCIQVGMVLHELCVNALKYAFKEERDNLLCIHIRSLPEKIHLKIRDNGDGLEDINSLYKTDSIGMQLIHSIVEDQLDGTIEFKNNKGLECNIFFPQKENI